MKNLLLPILFGLSVSVVFAQSKDELRLFKKARICGTISCYEDYLNKHPSGPYSKLIREQIDKMNQHELQEEKVVKKIKNRSKIDQLIFGKKYGLMGYYLSRSEEGGLYQIGLLAGFNFPIGFSMSPFGYRLEDEYLKASVVYMDISAYLSVRGCSGFYAKIGYMPAFGTTFTMTDQFFKSVTDPPDSRWVNQNYDPNDIEVKAPKFHYGIGYQNSFGPLMLGICFEWYNYHLTADSKERYSFEGLDKVVDGSSLNFMIGYALFY